jgi:cystathionine gamma-lyase
VSRLGVSTRAVHAGLPPPRQGEPLLPGPTLAAPYHLRGDPQSSEYVYGRYGNPTWRAYERALGELDGGEAVAFASGVAACAAVLFSVLPPRGSLVLPSDCYPAVRRIAAQLAERGVELRQAPTTDLLDALPERLDLLWVETPSNPGLDVCDLGAAAAAAHERGALLAVDNTLATPLGQAPLGLGADYCVTSATKHLSGHSDLVLGYVTAREPGRAAALREWRTSTGAIPGPFEAWLGHRSLATLALRLERGCANALALAERLSERDDVRALRYPGLPSDPAHELARRQMSAFGTLIGFDLGGRERAERFFAAAELVIEATSFGGVHTIAERRARWPGDRVPEGFVRLSAGCDDGADLLADVERALDASA